MGKAIRSYDERRETLSADTCVLESTCSQLLPQLLQHTNDVCKYVTQDRGSLPTSAFITPSSGALHQAKLLRAHRYLQQYTTEYTAAYVSVHSCSFLARDTRNAVSFV